MGVNESVFRGVPCIVLPWMENGTIRGYISVLLGRQVDYRVLRIKVANWVSVELAMVATSDHQFFLKLRGIICGVQYLHKKGIVHGDLRAVGVTVSPHLLMLTELYRSMS